ncbi:MAG: hypothetical protein HYZ53_24205 [Planctomycetes bacterium]|nr:hypothetical protein [Planctomycetota bacterium]
MLIPRVDPDRLRRLSPAHRSRAFALFVALGTLALLSGLAVVFVTVSTMEKRASENFANLVRARMLALSGVDYATARLRSLAQARPVDDPVFRPTPPNVTNPFPVLAGIPPEDWLFNSAPFDRPGPVANPFRVDSRLAIGFPLEVAGFSNAALGLPNTFAFTPSFPGSRVPNNAPADFLTSNPPLWTGIGTARPGGDYIVLKIRDSASKLNLNLYDMASVADQRKLGTMLNVVGQTLAQLNGGYDPVAGQGVQIVGFRQTLLPSRRFGSDSDLLAAIQAQLPASPPAPATPFPNDALSRFTALRDFVTFDGWADPTQFTPLNGARPANFTFPILAANDYPVAAQPRTPINLNTASEPVLTATMTGLEGFFLLVANEPTNVVPVKMGSFAVRWEKQILATINQATARALAQAIVQRRSGPAGPFRTWAEFEAWLTAGPYIAGEATPPAGVSADQKSLVLANANPNARLNKFNSNEGLARNVDKLDLRYRSNTSLDNGGTTEFCFSSMGFYEIESLGRVVQWDGNVQRILASKVASANCKIYDVARQTTQRDFLVTGSVAGLIRNQTRSLPESVNEPSLTGGGARIVGDNSTGDLRPLPVAGQPIGAAGNLLAGMIDGQLSASTEFDNANRGERFLHPFNSSLNANFTSLLENGKQEGSNTAGGGRSLLAGSDLSPEGLLNWRRGLGGGGEEEVTYQVTARNQPTAPNGASGSIEFWVKLATRPTEGSDEVLYYTVKQLANVPPRQGFPRQFWGVAAKVERYGTRLISTRFFWGSPDRERIANGPPPALDFITSSITQIEVSIANWNPNEWHRIVHTWTQGTEQRLYVDEQGPFTGYSFREVRSTGGSSGDAIYNGPVPGFDPSIDPSLDPVTGAPVPGGRDDPAQAINDPANWRIVNGTARVVNGMRLVTLDVTPERFQVGGYTFTPSVSMPVRGQDWSTQANNVLRRYANATIDTLRHADGDLGGGSLDRYSMNNAVWEGVFPFRAIRNPATTPDDLATVPGGRVNHVLYTVAYPRRYRNRALTPGDLRLLFGAGLQGAGGATAMRNDTRAISLNAVDGGGWNFVNGNLGPGLDNVTNPRAVRYRVQFRNPAGLSPLAVTPFLDDVTLFVEAGPVQFTSFAWVERNEM